MAPPGSEPESPVSLPSPEPSDSAEVARSLKLARMLWEEGQKREAVRTLQRGAAAAEEDGNDKRALALARTAADLSAHLPASVPPPATPSSQPPPVTPRVNSPESSVLVTVEEPPPSSSQEFDVPILITPETPEAVAATKATPVPAPTPGFPTPGVSVPTPVVPAVQPLSARPPASAPRPSSTPHAAPTPAVPRVAPMARVNTPSVAPEKASVAPEKASVAPEKQPSKVPHATNGASAFSFPVTAREVRVSVKRSALDESLLVVRPLAPGAKPPTGSREAVLVFSEVDD